MVSTGCARRTSRGAGFRKPRPSSHRSSRERESPMVGDMTWRAKLLELLADGAFADPDARIDFASLDALMDRIEADPELAARLDELPAASLRDELLRLLQED